MKITMLRLTSGCYALKGASNIVAGKNVSIAVVGGGDYLVEFHGKTVRIPSHRVDFAEIEADGGKVPVSELKPGK